MKCLFAQREAELNSYLERIADENNDVIVTSVNAGYLDMAMNWACSISQMDIKNYVFMATDEEAYEYLHTRGYNTFQIKSKNTYKVRKKLTVRRHTHIRNCSQGHLLPLLSYFCNFVFFQFC